MSFNLSDLAARDSTVVVKTILGANQENVPRTLRLARKRRGHAIEPAVVATKRLLEPVGNARLRAYVVANER